MIHLPLNTKAIVGRFLRCTLIKIAKKPVFITIKNGDIL